MADEARRHPSFTPPAPPPPEQPSKEHVEIFL
jgi:hypothetical protein